KVDALGRAAGGVVLRVEIQDEDAALRGRQRERPAGRCRREFGHLVANAQAQSDLRAATRTGAGPHVESKVTQAPWRSMTARAGNMSAQAGSSTARTRRPSLIRML